MPRRVPSRLSVRRSLILAGPTKAPSTLATLNRTFRSVAARSRLRAAQLVDSATVTKAVIDVGSNSVLLLVQENSSGTWQTIVETSKVTGLGTGTKSSGLLGEPGMAATLAALTEAFETARQHGADKPIAVGTMALRIATNSDEFLASAERQGTPVKVISGEEEARLGFLSVADDPLFAGCDKLSIIDPGGHSTELVTATRKGDGWVTEFTRSYAVGALGLRESPMSPELPGAPELLAAVDKIDNLIGMRYRPGQAGTAVVLGATGTNLASIREKLAQWDSDRIHGQVLDFEEVSRAVGWLCGMTDDERAGLTGIEPGRERTIHIGALILERFMQAIHVLDCTVSVRGWRHAYLQRLGQ